LIDVIKSMWVGRRLSTMERLSIASYLYHGHPYNLYTYGEVSGVPTGATIKDAREILPESAIAKFQNLANFSDYFRYNLLLKKGGWWCDTDTICLRPIDLIDEHVFVQEYPYDQPILINGGYLKAPANSPVMQWLVAETEATDWNKISWAEIGPVLLTKAVERFSMPSYPPAAFNPISYKDRAIFIEGAAPKIHEDAFAVHLWHEMWRQTEDDVDATYSAGCLYEQFKRQYGIAVLPGAYRSPNAMARVTRRLRRLKKRLRSFVPIR
jgi:hypothetical protein